MRYFAFCAALCSIVLCGCHESMEKRAQREAREYTEKYCPTPVQNFTRTDSVVFEMDTKTYHYYCSAVGDLDNAKVFDLNRSKIADALLLNVRENTSFRPYKKEGFAFQWTLRSDKDKKTVYFDRKFTSKDYNK
ncbi:hypothetical protein [uncultured Prevotella sp.]|uniref:hypothetical protein n=1 Tax=uncultured Prevotella sp. TaxID=159272 RepID=UPI0026070E06|nr:hypothetical protein [uncultured Prevotella sp.]